MRLLNLDFLRRAGLELPAEVVHHLEKTRTSQQPPSNRRVLKGRHDNIHNISDFGRVGNISPETIRPELIRYSRLNLPHPQRLPEDAEILLMLPIELMTQLEIPVVAFQESDVYDIHRARCTGSGLLRNHASRNDCVEIQTGDDQTYGALRGRLPARLVALFKIRHHTNHDTVHRLAAVQYMSVVNHGCPSDVHGLVTVQLSDTAQEFTIIDIGTILGLAHLIPETDRRWLVNNRIDLRTFNEIY